MGKKIVILSVIIIVFGIILVSLYLFYSFNIKTINLETFNISENPRDLATILEEVKQKEQTENFLANPRIKVFYGGVEVAAIDHLGNIYGVGNATFNGTNNGYGFFSYLGSPVTKIIKGFFTDLQVDNAINTSISNATEFYEDGERVARNSSLSGYLPIGDQRYNETTLINNSWNESHADTLYSKYYPRLINLTTITYTGNLTNGSTSGYSAGNNICNLTFTGSHLCDQYEITQWFANSQYTDVNGDAWVIAGSPKYIPATVPVSDCNGFTYQGTVSYLGNYWHFNSTTGGDGRALNCGSTLSLACCTY